jgi:hypothetical protein
VRAVEEASLASLLDARCDVDPVTLAARLCRLCAVTTRVGGVALVVLSRHNRSTVCASDALSAELEDLAFLYSEGPSVEAPRCGGEVLVADLLTESPSRWPWFAPAAVQAGARAMFAFPVYLTAGCLVGVLVLYRATPGGLARDQVRDGWAMAAAAAKLLSLNEPSSGAVMDWVVGDRSRFRARVHQAVGATMDRLRLDAGDARALIAAHAFVTGEPIGVVAEAILAHDVRLDEE